MTELFPQPDPPKRMMLGPVYFLPDGDPPKIDEVAGVGITCIVDDEGGSDSNDGEGKVVVIVGFSRNCVEKPMVLDC